LAKPIFLVDTEISTNTVSSSFATTVRIAAVAGEAAMVPWAAWVVDRLSEGSRLENVVRTTVMAARLARR
jgi:hypothetical protein